MRLRILAKWNYNKKSERNSRTQKYGNLNLELNKSDLTTEITSKLEEKSRNFSDKNDNYFGKYILVFIVVYICIFLMADDI